MKTRTIFVCQQCDAQAPKFVGRCPECGAWNSYVETVISTGATGGKADGARAGGVAGRPQLLKDVRTGDHPRIPTGYGEIDRVLGGGIVPGSISLLGGEPGIGKCVTGDTRVLDPVTGDYQPITEYQAMGTSVLGMDEATHRLSVQPVTVFHDHGVQPIVEVKTRLGRTLRCTASHPVFTSEGWQSVGSLTSRTRIAAPRVLPYFGSKVMPDPEVRLIAYVLSDGSAQSDVTVTATIPEIIEDLADLARHFNMTLRVYERPGNKSKMFKFVIPLGERAEARMLIMEALKSVQAEKGLTWVEWASTAGVTYDRLNWWRQGRSVPSEVELHRLADAANVPVSRLAPDARHLAEITTPIARFLADAGVRFSTAKNKKVPACIFRLPREHLASFLKILFSCDGSVYVTKNGVPALSYSTISKRLAQDVQHLLLRFGFVVKLRTKPMTVKSEPYTAYELQMLGVGEVQRFLQEIGIWGREEAKAIIVQMPVPSLPSTHFDTIPTGTVFWEHIEAVTEGVSFKAMSRKAGMTIHPGRIERPLCRSTVAAIAQAYPSPLLQRLADGDIYWDEIESIVPAGEETVYDLTVPGTANFVANDLIVHNSTLLLGAADRVGTSDQPVLYVSAEESPQQIKMRAERLGIAGDRVALLAETDAETIIETARAMQPRLVIVDSIQTIATGNVTSVPGSISQVRECTVQLMRMAKASHIAVLLIGHVTKDGTVAGPRALEHIVDAVLYLEGERFHSYRLLRSVKNRFGATEVGIFEMRGEGMVEVADPSGIFLADRAHRATGSAVTISLEGTRPLLVEVQALASATSYGTPTRTVTGVDHTRLLMLLAVLAKRTGLRLGQHDVYVNVVGGIELSEPAVDLGIAAAIASSFKERQIGGDLALIGEVGLGGELRSVTRVETRLREAARLGFQRCIVPQANAAQVRGVTDLHVITVGSLAEALSAAMEGGD